MDLTCNYEYFIGVLHILRCEFLKLGISEIVNSHPCSENYNPLYSDGYSRTDKYNKRRDCPLYVSSDFPNIYSRFVAIHLGLFLFFLPLFTSLLVVIKS